MNSKANFARVPEVQIRLISNKKPRIPSQLLRIDKFKMAQQLSFRSLTNQNSNVPLNAKNANPINIQKNFKENSSAN